jgi:tRNA(Arg) A34 adenosine deaminase TadA
MSIIKLNAEKIKRFINDASKLAYKQDLKPMGAIFVKDNNEVIVCVDNECSDKTFIDCLQALVKQHKNG